MNETQIVRFDIEVFKKRKISYSGYVRNCNNQSEKERYTHRINLTLLIINELIGIEKTISRYNPGDIEKAVSDYYCIPIESMKGKSRKHELVDARQICIITHRYVGLLNLYDCADRYNRNHATSVHAIKCIKNNIDQNDNRSKRTRKFLESHEINGEKLIDIIIKNC